MLLHRLEINTKYIQLSRNTEPMDMPNLERGVRQDFGRGVKWKEGREKGQAGSGGGDGS